MQPRGRILLAASEANVRTAVGELLVGEGYAVLTAVDGVDALDVLDAFAPDLVLTELELPKLGAIDLMREATARDPEPVCVVMVPSAAVDAAIAAMRRGAAAYLVKPIHAGELALVVARALEQRSLRAAAALLRDQLAEPRRTGPGVEPGPGERPAGVAVAAGDSPAGGPPPVPGSTITELERFAILATLEHTGGSTSRAARILGVSRRKIQYKLHEYGVVRPTSSPRAVRPSQRDGAGSPAAPVA
jgi:DNA-binding NtrC family response regulator